MPFLLFPIWLLLVFSAGWLFFPISRRIFGHALPDGGLAVGRILFLSLWTLGAFWLGRLGIPTLYSSGLYVLLAAGGLLLWRREKQELNTEIRTRRRAIYSTEAIFLGVFLIFFLLRGFWSDTNGNNGEKGMDGALVAAIAHADRIPPPNPYAAGARLQSYYTFGHLETALLQNTAGTSVRWSYNLMCATIPALCISAMFALGAGLTARLWGGAFVAFIVLFLGTLQPVQQWLNPTDWSLGFFLRLDPMAVSRVLPNAINEFPFFTFNQGDLHAHYFSFTLQIAAMSLALALFLRFSVKRALVTAAVLGSLILTNTWDFPAYFLLVALSILNTKSLTCQRPIEDSERLGVVALSPLATKNFPRQRPIEVYKRFGVVFLVLALAILLALPFLLGLTSAAGGPKPLSQPASPLREWLLMWGFFTMGWWAFAAYSIFKKEKHWGWVFLGLGTAIVLVALRADWGYPEGFKQPYTATGIVTWKSWGNPARLVLPLIIANIGLAVGGIFALSRTADTDTEDEPTATINALWTPQFLCLMALCGLIALLVAETTWAGFLGDINVPGFDDNKRQDTVFKFGMQTWFLWGTATATGAFLTLKRWPYLLKIFALQLMVIMAVSSVVVVANRTRKFSKWDGWDTWAHLAPAEKEAASWLETHIQSGQNILEAEQREGGDYTVYTRYTHATGIPTVIGPQAHSFQWSPANARDAGKEWEEVFRRKANARSIFENPANRSALLRMYQVKYIVWGELEREQYGEASHDSLLRDPNLTSIARFGEAIDPHRVEIFRFDSL